MKKITVKGMTKFLSNEEMRLIKGGDNEAINEVDSCDNPENGFLCTCWREGYKEIVGCAASGIGCASLCNY